MIYSSHREALQIQLKPDAPQHFKLLQTMEPVNEAARLAARRGFEARVFNRRRGPSLEKQIRREANVGNTMYSTL